MSKADDANTAHSDHPLEHVIDSIIELGNKQEQVSVGDIQETVGHRSFGPFLFIPAIFEISPLGGVPGVPTLLAIIVILTAAQLLFGRKHFWLPSVITKRSIKGERIGPAMEKIRPAVRGIDKVLRPRLQRIIQSPWNRAVAGVCVLATVTVPPLELVPFGSTAPFIGIALIGLGFLGQDGLFVWVGVIAAIVGLYLVTYAF